MARCRERVPAGLIHAGENPRIWAVGLEQERLLAFWKNGKKKKRTQNVCTALTNLNLVGWLDMGSTCSVSLLLLKGGENRHERNLSLARRDGTFLRVISYFGHDVWQMPWDGPIVEWLP